MDCVLTGLQGVELFVYMDDIVVYASSLEEHSKKLITLLARLKSAGLALQPEKCHFLKRYYRRFISDFARLSKPLTLLLKDDVEFIWTSIQREAFEILRDKICTEPILQYPDFKKPFVLTTDASNDALGGVLSQGHLGQDLPIAFASRTLQSADLNYSTIEKELLSIVFNVKHFRPYLFGQNFTLVTDHRPLVWLHGLKDPVSRLTRWRIKLSVYDYTIVYKAGKINSNADALSRNPSERNESIRPNANLTATITTGRTYVGMVDACRNDDGNGDLGVVLKRLFCMTLVEKEKEIEGETQWNKQGPRYQCDKLHNESILKLGGDRQLFRIIKIQSTAYHPQSLGSLERSHQTLVEYLRQFETTTNWDDGLRFAVFSYNTSIHEATGFAPYTLVFGKEALIPNSFTLSQQEETYLGYLKNLCLKLDNVHAVAKDQLQLAKERSKKYYDHKANPKHFKKGENVNLKETGMVTLCAKEPGSKNARSIIGLIVI
ncbi:uncharacterized protein LOC117175565 [Belonocnema kinseyi]|uniref:uncharacterized protein LOC117175565 n=1 Tax=Belonocnema kinseyi TaxID=2817044 RepID=UPI00143DF1EF|nr:uncharacterized protein LOC117175565 [Belonocnema kinseyi]